MFPLTSGILLVVADLGLPHRRTCRDRGDYRDSSGAAARASLMSPKLILIGNWFVTRRGSVRIGFPSHSFAACFTPLSAQGKAFWGLLCRHSSATDFFRQAGPYPQEFHLKTRKRWLHRSAPPRRPVGRVVLAGVAVRLLKYLRQLLHCAPEKQSRP